MINMELAELLLEAKEERYQGFDYEYDDFCQVQPSLTVLLDGKLLARLLCLMHSRDTNHIMMKFCIVI